MLAGGQLQHLARKAENGENPKAKEPFLRDLDPDELYTHLDDIDAMILEDLEEQLPKAHEALSSLEARLEELMSLRDATLVSAAAMEARLGALKQSGRCQPTHRKDQLADREGAQLS